MVPQATSKSLVIIILSPLGSMFSTLSLRVVRLTPSSLDAHIDWSFTLPGYSFDALAPVSGPQLALFIRDFLRERSRTERNIVTKSGFNEGMLLMMIINHISTLRSTHQSTTLGRTEKGVTYSAHNTKGSIASVREVSRFAGNALRLHSLHVISFEA